MKRTVTLSVLASGLTFAVAAAQSRRPVAIDDLMRLVTLTDAQISPDGSRVAYVVSTPNVPENRHQTDIWLVGTDGGTPIRLTTSAKRDWSPRWSPDGSRLAFLSDRDGPPNLYVLPTGGGEAAALTSVKGGVQSFDWSPDGARIAFLAADPPSDSATKAVEERAGVQVIDGSYSQARLNVVAVATKAITTITPGDRQVDGFSWSPDGARFAISVRPTPRVMDGSKSDLYLVAADGGRLEPLVVQDGPETSPRWSPDGRWIAFVSGGGKSNSPDDLYLVAPGGGAPRRIAPEFDGGFDGLEWAPSSRELYFSTTAGVRVQVQRVSIDGGRIVPVTTGDRVHTSYSLSKDGTTMALGIQDPSSPTEIHVTATASYRPTRLTWSNPVLDSLTLGQIEVVRWKSKDGKEIEGLLLKPVGFDRGRRYPVLTYVHGGPSGVFTLGFEPQLGSAPIPLQAGPYPLQVFAGMGYAVFMPNPRGSSGYGKAFRRANFKDWGYGDFQDIMTGLDHLVATGVADEAQLGMMGWSYGGYMTAWTISQTNRFKAASVGAGMPNLVSLHGATDIPTALSGEYFGAVPWKDKESYQRSSAIYFAGNIRTPTLIQHGEKDDRVQLSQAWELYRALEVNEVPREFAVYPRQGHLIIEPKQQKDMLSRNLIWFTKWIREQPRT